MHHVQAAHESMLSNGASVAAIVATVLVVAETGRRWLRKRLRILIGELTHNGGTSLKDMVRDARDASRQARDAATASSVYARGAETAASSAEASARFAVERANSVDRQLSEHLAWSRDETRRIADRLEGLTPVPAQRAPRRKPPTPPGR